jgi:fatty-acyl-CoA synthase
MTAQYTLTGQLERAAQQAGSNIALYHETGAMTFGELSDLAKGYAAGLEALGISGGDRVALWLPNSCEHYALAYAVWRLGAINVGVNTRFKAKEVEDIVGRSGAKLLAYQPGFKDIDFAGILAGVDPDALAQLQTVVTFGETEAGKVLGRPSHPLAELEAHGLISEDRATSTTPCQIFTTSGTTSRPKFVLHEHQSLAIHAERLPAFWELDRPDGVLFQAAPLCGVVGFNVATLGIAAMRPQVIQAVYEPVSAATLFVEHGVTHMIGMDAMYERMVESRPEKVPFPKLAPAPSFGTNPPLEPYLALARDRGLPICAVYGMSEVCALFAFQPMGASEADRVIGGGLPVHPETEVRIGNPDTDAVLGLREEGEIQIKGPTLMKEYADNPDATAKAFTDDGFLKTGDLGFIREDGAFVYLARMGDVLRLAGFLTNPMDIEKELESDPAIYEAQVVQTRIGARDRAFAFVLLTGDAPFDEARALAHCKARLADYKVPVRVVPLEEFPVTQSANAIKVRKTDLRTMAETILAEEINV